ncbi:hypothetical protein G7072_01760 [Nocardioides sp. HDW12B]|uniref:hypothetical protein n=1 Tax=Nocardioides sp. HDW12B TaxID=2714939 RepID=UPI00140A17D3|nr:hypothetical protein [Nocardioides sp. HDW12B]QIK65231.1 hypothetical protein G7072_01760 [Nocardioides sp. HDW12B]
MPSDVDGTRPEQRAIEALSARAPGAALTGWAALYFHGAAFFDGVRRDGSARPVAVAVGPGTGRRVHQGSLLSYEKLPDADVEEVEDVRVTSPVRALFDELRCPPHARELVVAADMALAAGLDILGEVRRMTQSRSSWRRASWVATALEHVSERSRSPQETRLRLIWTLDAALPAPLVNQPVFTLDGDLVCIADLFDEEAGLVAEYDGAEHRHAGRHARDVARYERVREVGLEHTSVTGPDIDNRRLVVRRLRAGRDRSAFLPEGARRWTLAEPPGWVAPWGLASSTPARAMRRAS